MLTTAFLMLALIKPAQAADFVKEPGVRLSSAVLPGAAPTPISGSTVFYYIRGSTAVFSASSPAPPAA